VTRDFIETIGWRAPPGAAGAHLLPTFPNRDVDGSRDRFPGSRGKLARQRVCLGILMLSGTLVPYSTPMSSIIGHCFPRQATIDG
jgi:hypothetical protein